jgi:hypothetical protein
LAVVASTAGSGFAQEGHPLRGSWIGTWNGNTHGNDVLIVMDWNGTTVTGSINPGTDNIKITGVTLDPENWTVKLEADTGNKSKGVHYVIEGKIEQLELPSRSIVGTWKSEEGNGELKIVRQ